MREVRLGLPRKCEQRQIAAAIEGGTGSECRVGDSGNDPQTLDELRVKSRERITSHSSFRNCKSECEDARCIKSWVDREHLFQTAKHQSRAREQHKRESHFDDDE